MVCLYSPLQSQSLINAQKYIGHTELKYNRSPLIDKWNKQAGAKAGSSWCMSFVYGIHLETYSKPILYRTASCSRQLQVSNKIGSKVRVIKTSLIGSYKLKAGSIFIIKQGKFSEKNIGTIWNGHTGYIDLDCGDMCITIEGNTNRRLTRESKGRDGVWKLKRNKRTFIAILELQ